jgi:hypothetical protein
MWFILNKLSIPLLEALHGRWLVLIRSFRDAEFARRVSHPEWGIVSVEWLLGSYAWHCRHHVAQIERLRKREGW